MSDLIIEDKGTIDFKDCYEEMIMLVKSNPKKSYIWSLEHHNVYTIGISDKETNVEVTIHVDPRGKIPSWIVNLIQKNWPYRFIKGMETRSLSITPILGPELLNFASLAKPN